MHTHVHPQLFSPELTQQVNDKGASSLGHNSPCEIQLSPKVAFAESEVKSIYEGDHFLEISCRMKEAGHPVLYPE